MLEKEYLLNAPVITQFTWGIVYDIIWMSDYNYHNTTVIFWRHDHMIRQDCFLIAAVGIYTIYTIYKPNAIYRYILVITDPCGPSVITYI
jgi:hypothetical protein